MFLLRCNDKNIYQDSQRYKKNTERKQRNEEINYIRII